MRCSKTFGYFQKCSFCFAEWNCRAKDGVRHFLLSCLLYIRFEHPADNTQKISLPPVLRLAVFSDHDSGWHFLCICNLLNLL